MLSPDLQTALIKSLKCLFFHISYFPKKQEKKAEKKRIFLPLSS